MSQQIAELPDHLAYTAWIALDQRRDSIEGVEEKVRVELASQSIEPRFGELPLKLRRVRLAANGTSLALPGVLSCFFATGLFAQDETARCGDAERGEKHCEVV